MAVGSPQRGVPVPRFLFAVVDPFRRFFRTQAAGGVVLLVASAVAMVWANSSFRASYHAIFHARLDVTLAGQGLQWPIHHWINDALMTVFFLTAGLEIKRELSIGELRTPRRAALPLVAAAGGMAAPAMIFLAFNGAATARGWAIPAATDIAFALGCLSLVRSRVPTSLFVFLTALAIFDDLGAILVIALFYSGTIDVPALVGAGLISAALFSLGRLGVQRVWPYVLLGAILWVLVLRSGLHATLAGVIIGLAVPACPRQSQESVLGDLDAALHALRHGRGGDGAIAAIERHLEAVQAPVERMLHVLHGPVAFVVVPLFALANAGVSVSGDVGLLLTSPVALGVGMGLVAGKTVGVLGAVALSVKLGLAPMPTGARWGHVLGVAIMAGIGFTMSLFIAQLAFPEAPARVDEAKVGILGGSCVAAVLGMLVLRLVAPPIPRDAADEDEAVVLSDSAPAPAAARAPDAPVV